MNADRQINMIYKFLKLLPQEIIQEGIDNIKFCNRQEERTFSKYKTFDTKLRALLEIVNFRVSLITNIYQKYKLDYNFDESLDYQDIVASINAENCHSMCLYTLYRCCDDEFDRKHFVDFIHSDQFKKTISNGWVDAPDEVSLDPNQTLSEETIIEEEKSMRCYIGYIEFRHTYYNFKPVYLYDDVDKTITEISDETLSAAFPEYSSINLAYKKHLKSEEFLSSLNCDNSDSNRISSIYAVSFSEEELEDNDRDRNIRKRIDLQKLCDAGVDLSERIFSVSKLGMYKIVTPKEHINNESFNSAIHVNEIYYSPNDYVLLSDDSKLFGPFILNERPIDGSKNVRPESGSHQYLLEYYDYSGVDIITFEKTPYMQDTVYTDLFFVRKSPKIYDAITDSVLLSKLVDSIDLGLLSTNPEEFERLYSKSPFLADVSAEIRESRMNRIQEILKNTAEFDDQKKKLIETFIENSGDSLFTLIGDKIKESPKYKKLQDDADGYQESVKRLKEQCDILLEENQLIKSELEERASNEPDFHANDEYEKLLKENEELKKSLSLVDEVETYEWKLKEVKEAYDKEATAYDNKVIEVNKKNQELAEIKNKIKEFITAELDTADATKMLHAAFDPYISNAMIEAASKYHSKEETEQYELIAGGFNSIEPITHDRDTLIETLISGVQHFRSYSRNEILNLYICISQNFLTIFSGEPGTGKTSICNILASSLGLNSFAKNNPEFMNRYIPVSVERGWSSKRDLIGYFNPLTKKYDRSSAKIYDGLMLLNKERNNSKYPFFILLDEANLSPVEYYWADFMRAADNFEDDTFINIGMPDDVFIPKTLRFLATINNDQTTEKLSPRLIDRAWIVKLPKVSTIIEPAENVIDYFNSPILWSEIENTFIQAEAKEIALKTLVEHIYKLFEEHHLSVSPRVQQSIKRYVCVAQEIMDDEIGVCSKKEKAIDFAIVQKLLPKIDGYYKDFERLFASLKQICDENNLFMTKDAIESMEEFQRQNMGYCQYLV